LGLHHTTPVRRYTVVLYYSALDSLLPSFPTRRSSDLPPWSATLSFDAGGALGFLQQIELDEFLRLGRAGHLSDAVLRHQVGGDLDRKSTRLNSSHVATSYAAFCLNKKTTR